MLAGLTEGRIVHYVYAADDLPPSHKKFVGAVIPAIVVNAAAESGGDGGATNLTGFTDGPNHGLGLVVRLEGRAYSLHGDHGTWHWPQDEIVPRIADVDVAESPVVETPQEPEVQAEPVAEPVADEPTETPTPAPKPNRTRRQAQ